MSKRVLFPNLAFLDGRFVNVPGDTMTGALVITPTADGTSIFRVNQANGTVVFNVDTTNARTGFGTATPLYLVHVFTSSSGATASVNADDFVFESDGNTGFSILSPNDATGNMSFGDPENNVAGYLQYTHATDTMAIGVSGAARFKFTSFELSHAGQFTISNTAGNIIITPFASLVINGDTTIDGNADEVQLTIQAHSSQTANIVEIQDSSANVLVNITGVGNLQTQKGRIKNTTRVTTTYAILVTDDVIFANTDGAAWTATLPAGVEGQTFKIINSGSSANDLTIAPDGSEHLIGANSNFTLTDGETLVITYNATDGWY